MDKTDSYIETMGYEPFSSKCAARVTGLQQASSWIDPQYQSKKIWELNGEVQLDEFGVLVSPETSPYIWIGDMCSKIRTVPA